MGKVRVVTSGKGGVGKTTAVANIGTGLAREGHSVALVDTDIGLRNLDVVMGLENRIIFDLVDVVDQTCKLEQALIRDRRFQNLQLLPAAQTRDKTAVTPEQMKKVIEALREQNDYVLIDCPAGIEQGFYNAIAGADKAVVVTMPEVSSIRDADRIIGLLNANGITSQELVINRIRPEMVRRGEMMRADDVLDVLGVPLLGLVPDDEQIIRSTNMGQPVVLDKHAPAGQAYRNIVRRIGGAQVPMMNLEGPQGWRRFWPGRLRQAR